MPRGVEIPRRGVGAPDEITLLARAGSKTKTGTGKAQYSA
jgi:hypothetical protein